MSPWIAVAENIAQARQMGDVLPTLPWSSFADFFKSHVCTAPLYLWTDRFSFVTIFFVKNSVAPEALLPQGYLVALASYSVTRSTTVSHHDDSDRFHCVSDILPDAFPVYKLSGAQHSNPRCRNSASLAHNCADLSALCRSFGAISSSQHSCIKDRAYTYRTTTPFLSTT
jgi:hypothetical protein